MHKRYNCALGKIIDNMSEKAAHIELPIIKIPDFYGKSTEWQSFIELFDRIVHNNDSVNASVKMQYLKISLKGEASKIVNHIAPTAENYAVCYETLHKRYDNKRELISKMFDSFFNLARHKSDNSSDLKKLHDATTELLLSVRSLNFNTNDWELGSYHELYYFQ